MRDADPLDRIDRIAAALERIANLLERKGGSDGRPAVIETVFWEEDPGRCRDVVAYCKTCYAGRSTRREPVVLVSPQGKAHLSSLDGETDCGHDATGPDWWWRL